MISFQDLNLSMERLTSNKAFTNKLWNAGKFLLQNMPDRSDATAWDVLLGNKVPHQIIILHDAYYSTVNSFADLFCVSFPV
jgi:valyl-tRNA synthetase